MAYFKIIVALTLMACAVASCERPTVSLTVENTAMASAVSAPQPLS